MLEDSTDPYSFVLTESLTQRPFPNVLRRTDRLVIAEPTVERARLMATLGAHIRSCERGVHALSVEVRSDPREPSPPPFGIFQWAPGGAWDRAADGDPMTWVGYEWAIIHDPPKLDGAPAVRPVELAYDICARYWSVDHGVHDDIEAAGEATKQRIADELGVPMNVVDEALLAMVEWQFA